MGVSGVRNLNRLTLLFWRGCRWGLWFLRSTGSHRFELRFGFSIGNRRFTLREAEKPFVW
jgi:hypothetical protein